LTTPFFYNPAAGNLIMDLQNFSSGNSGGTLIPALDATSASPTLVSRVYAFSATATTATGGDQMGLVTRFNFVPTPEPSTIALLALGWPFYRVLSRNKPKLA
jgi:hypothetical protein